MPSFHDQPIDSNRVSALYSRTDNATLVAVPVEGRGSTFDIGTESPLFRVYQRWDVWSYDVFGSGQSFVVNGLSVDSAKPMVLVTNWPETLRRP